jgi:hypothetical protein
MPESIQNHKPITYNGGSARGGGVAMGGRGRIAGRTWLVP